MTCARVEPERRAPTEIGEVHDVADNRGGARDATAGISLPPDTAGVRVERIEVSVVGADVDGRAETGSLGHGGRRVHVCARLMSPVELAATRVECVHPAIGVADEDASVAQRGGGVELAVAEQPTAAGGDPYPMPVVLAARPHVAPVVAEVEQSVAQRRACLDRPPGVVGPDDMTVASVHRVDGSAFGAEVEPAPAQQGGGLGPRDDVAGPLDPGACGVEG